MNTLNNDIELKLYKGDFSAADIDEVLESMSLETRVSWARDLGIFPPQGE